MNTKQCVLIMAWGFWTGFFLAQLATYSWTRLVAVDLACRRARQGEIDEVSDLRRAGTKEHSQCWHI